MKDATEADWSWLARAVELSRRSFPVGTAYSVGAIIVAADGEQLTEGYSRDDGPHLHAEESALVKAERLFPPDSLTGATIYSSMEPCTIRKSRPRTCTELILASGIKRVVFAVREPPVFVDCIGAELLQSAGIEVIEIPELADLVRTVNAHILNPNP